MPKLFFKNPALPKIARFYTGTLIAHARAKTLLSVVLNIFLGLTQGVGLVMLLPFLKLIGIGANSVSENKAVDIFSGLFAALGLPMTLTSVLAVYVSIIVFHTGLSWYRETLNAEIVNGFTRYLRNRMYEKMARVEWLAFLRMRPSDINHSILTDIQRVSFGAQQTLQLSGALVISAVHVFVAFALSIPLTLLAIACGGGFALLFRPLNRMALRAGEKMREFTRRMFSSVDDHLSGMKIVKSYQLEDRLEKRFKTTTARVEKENIHFTKIHAATRACYQVGAAASMALFFYTAVELFDLPVLRLLLLVFIFARLSPQFSRIQQLFQHIVSCLPSFEASIRTEKQFDEAREPQTVFAESCFRLNNGIRFEKVSFSYRNGSNKQAIKDLDLEVPAGQFTAVAGPSGAGKSTIADLLMGLLHADRGRISIDGRPLEGEFVHQWRSCIGYVPQDTFLFHDTVRENLVVTAPDADDDELWRVLEMAAAKDFVERLPRGLDTVVGDRGVRLSGGERQRIALARALLRKPSLLLLDEATSSLDRESEHRIQQAVERLHGSLTIVVIAHRLSTIRKADTILVVENGRLVENGPWEALTGRCNGRFQSLSQNHSEFSSRKNERRDVE